MFENRVLRRIFWPKRDEVKEECRELHNDLYSSSSVVQVTKSRRMSSARLVARKGERIGEACTGFLVRKPEGRRQLGRSRFRWVDNIKMDLQDVGCGVMDLIEFFFG